MKLTTMFVAATLTATLALTGCKKKDDAAKTDNTAEKKTAEAPAAAGTATAPAAAGAATATAPAAPAAAGNLPTECNDYKAAIDKLSSCDKMPQQARDALKQAYDQASAGWASLPAEAKANLATACKAGTDAVTTSAKQVCGW
jgi:hypothetical protein